MRTRLLGSTGIEVPVISLGTVKIGRNQAVKYPVDFSLPTDQAVKTLLYKALDLGVNLLDTAPAYGLSEERLGQLLIAEREKWLISTKVGEEFSDGKSTYHFTPEHTRFSVERSLQRLATDYLDLVMIHSNGIDEINLLNNTGVVETLKEMQQKGYIRAIGASTKTIDGGILALEKMDMAMVTYNLQDLTQHTVLERAMALSKGILIKKALSSGHICNKAESKEDPIYKSLNVILRNTSTSSIVIGTSNPKHLEKNVQICQRVLSEID